MGKIKMGVIGLGGIATGTHIPGIMRSQSAELTAICDINEETLKTRQKAYGIDDAHIFNNHLDLLKCSDVDAVCICTPNDSHFSIALDAIKFKKPYALEKPVTLNKDEARILLEESEKNNVTSMVCFSYRFKPAARYARDLILQGQIGQVRHVYAQYFQSWAGKNLPLYWRFEKARSGSGTLADLGSHALDLVRFFTDKNYIKIFAHNGTFVKERKSLIDDKMVKVDVDDYSHYLAEMDDGIAAVFEITRFGYGRGNYQRIEIYGDNGAIVYGLEKDDTLEVCIGDFYKNNNLFVNVPVPSWYQSDQMQSFFDRINKKDVHAAHIRDGYMNQVLLDAILDSAEQEKSVRIEY